VTYEEFVRRISTSVWGFSPHRQVKPVHFANGFFKSIAGDHANITLLQQAGAGYRSGKNRVTTPEFVAKISEKYYCEGNDLPLKYAEELRTSIDLILNQDDAFFFGGSFATATLTHAAHISSDPSDSGTGPFLAQVLMAWQERENKEVLTELRKAIYDQSDDVFTVTLPLLHQPLDAIDRQPEWLVGPEIKERLSESEILKSVCEAFEVASSHRAILEKTLFLQRIVALGCFGVYLYVINRACEMHGRESRVPILLASPLVQPEVREASRATLIRARQQVEQAFELGLRREMSYRGEDRLDAGGYRSFVDRLLTHRTESGTRGKMERDAWSWFVDEYAAQLVASESPFEAFVRVFTRMAFLHYDRSPEDFIEYLGRLQGLVYPREGGRGLKYYRPTPSFLDMLCVALLKPGDEVTAEEFWDRAWRKFGIVSGYRGTLDAECLAEWGVRQTSISRLRQNGHELIQELKRMGLAEEFADDVCVIRIVA